MQIKMRINRKATRACFRQKWKELNSTQEAVAHKLKMSQEQLSRLLAGKFQRDTDNLKKLCTLLDAKCIYVPKKSSLAHFPAAQQCVIDLMDGSRKRERAVVRLLKSAQALV